MAYSDAPSRITWDPPGFDQGVTIERFLEGQWYAWRIPFNGVVTQALAAEVLGVSLMTINTWVREGKLRTLQVKGAPSHIPMHEIKRVKAALEATGWRPRPRLTE